MAASSLKGNVKAWEVIRDTVGEKPISKQEFTGGGFVVNLNHEAVEVERD
jgi:hypothetical protein